VRIYTDELAPHFRRLLGIRARELRDIVQPSRHAFGGAEEAGHGEVADFRDAALQESQAVVEDEQPERALHALEQVSAARRRLASQGFGIAWTAATRSSWSGSKPCRPRRFAPIASLPANGRQVAGPNAEFRLPGTPPR